MKKLLEILGVVLGIAWLLLTTLNSFIETPW